MANEKRLIYLEDAIALLEKDIAENKDALKTAYHGDKDVIRAEMNGVRAAIHILKHHASHCGTVDAVEVVHGRWLPDMEEFDDDPAVGIRGGVFQTGWKCSICGRTEQTKEPYCNCGAKMDGDGNG